MNILYTILIRNGLVCIFMFKYLYATNEIQSISSNEKLKSKEARVNSRKKNESYLECELFPAANTPS